MSTLNFIIYSEEIPEIHLGRIFSTLFDHSSANFIGNSDALFVASSSLFVSFEICQFDNYFVVSTRVS